MSKAPRKRSPTSAPMIVRSSLTVYRQEARLDRTLSFITSPIFQRARDYLYFEAFPRGAPQRTTSQTN
jgi:hypothetical protein